MSRHPAKWLHSEAESDLYFNREAIHEWYDDYEGRDGQQGTHKIHQAHVGLLVNAAATDRGVKKVSRP